MVIICYNHINHHVYFFYTHNNRQNKPLQEYKACIVFKKNMYNPEKKLHVFEQAYITSKNMHLLKKAQSRKKHLFFEQTHISFKNIHNLQKNIT